MTYYNTFNDTLSGQHTLNLLKVVSIFNSNSFKKWQPKLHYRKGRLKLVLVCYFELTLDTGSPRPAVLASQRTCQKDKLL